MAPTATLENQPDNSQKKQKAPVNKKKKIIRLLILVFLIAGMIYAVPWFRYKMTHESTDDAFIDGRITHISPRISGHVVQVHVNDNQWVKKGDLLVELDPRDFEIRLESAQAALESALASDLVRGKDVDLSMIASQSRTDDATAIVAASKNMIQAAEAQAEIAKSQVREAEIQVEIARMGLELTKSEASAALAEHNRNLADLERYRKMLANAVISEQQTDHMAASVKVSQARLESAEQKIKAQESTIRQHETALATVKNRLKQAQAQIRTSQAQLIQARAGMTAAQAGPTQVDQSRAMTQMAKAELNKARSGLAQAQLNLSFTKIYAEINGYVSGRSVEPGTFVQVGQPLMALVSEDVWVEANFKETQLTRMKPGQPVTIQIDTYPDILLEGQVESIQRGTGSRFSLLPPQNATGNFVKVVQRIPVKIVFKETPETRQLVLVPGMSVVPEVDIRMNTTQAGLR